MSDVITAINLSTQKLYVINGDHNNYYDSCWKVEIVTTKQIIVFSIEKEQSCCERYGIYNKSEKEQKSDSIKTFDFITNFINAQIIEVLGMSDIITQPDTNQEYFVDFNILTDKGKICLTAYNYHYGYYCHSVTASFIDKNGEKRNQEVSI